MHVVRFLRILQRLNTDEWVSEASELHAARHRMERPRKGGEGGKGREHQGKQEASFQTPRPTHGEILEKNRPEKSHFSFLPV